MTHPTPDGTAWWKDWTQYFCPGPRRVFSTDEMAVAGQQPWPSGIDSFLYANVVMLLVVSSLYWPRATAAVAWIGGLTLTWAVLAVARWLWRGPSRRRLALASYGAVGLLMVLLFGLGAWLDRGDEAAGVALLGVFVFVTTSWLLLVIFRVAQIEARLREIADQQQQLALSRRLATAQIHPHFLFNTLASLTHWVEVGDARAAPLLKNLATYLRATLPLFERESMPLAEEWALVRTYLAIMQVRLGERLRWSIEHDPALDGLLVPPGTVLTLVENAITHGIEPALRGGTVTLHSERLPDGRARIRVDDDGAGLPQPFKPGLGLSNTRDRFRHLYGERAQLTLQPLHADGSGCRSDVLIHDSP